MIPIDSIQLLNPRMRNQHVFGEIVESIDTIGLKRPITVSRRAHSDGPFEYNLVCGQGRLEAYQRLGMTEIPAMVVDANEEDCLIMSLVENIARRQHPPIEVMREIGSLYERGYDERQIAKKLGVTASWVSMLITLLERGEEHLLGAVESGLIPVTLAVAIARSDDKGIQQALADAYTQGILKGRKLSLVRRMLNRRSIHGKHERPKPYRQKENRKLDAQKLLHIYQREVSKQQLLIRQADITQKRLLFAVRALQHLFEKAEFVNLLKEEGVDTVPAPLGNRMAGGISS
jgi:ParB family chromosome partitioning protein